MSQVYEVGNQEQVTCFHLGREWIQNILGPNWNKKPATYSPGALSYLLNCVQRNLQSSLILSKGVGRVSENIARELIKDNHKGKTPLGV